MTKKKLLLLCVSIICTSSWASSLYIDLDDTMLSHTYKFIDRIVLKYNFHPFHQNRRPYTVEQLANILQFSQKQKLSSIERQKALFYLQHFSTPPALIEYRTNTYKFKLNCEIGLFFTRRTYLVDPNEGNELAWQVRPIISGKLNDSLAFKTDLRFFAITGINLPDTIRTEVEVNQLNEKYFDTAALVPSNISFSLPWFNILIGKQNLSWGPGRYSNLLLSDHAMPMEMICISGDYGKVGFQAFHAIGQSSTGNKVLSGHRVDINPFPIVRIGISEIVVIGIDKFDIRFINPVTIYTVSEISGEGYYKSGSPVSQGNVLISGDFSLNLRPGIQTYVELMIDDFQPRYRWKSHLHWASKWGLLFGVYLIDPLKIPNTALRFEYVFLNQYTYTHSVSVNSYTHLERPIGHKIGPDSQSLWLQFQHYWTDSLSTELTTDLQHKGEQDINVPRDQSRPEDEHWHYLSGTEEIRLSLGANVRFIKLAKWLISSSYKLTLIQNAKHKPQVRDRQQEIACQILYRF